MSADEATFTELAAEVMRRPPRLGTTRLVAIDGPSGAGKTWFASRLGKQLNAPVVHTDDLLDGWDDQLTFWPRLEAQVLEPLRRGEPGAYQRYLWHRREFGGAWVHVPPAHAVLVEGVSAARQPIHTQLSMAVFVVAPADLRFTRALARDGDDSIAFRAYLERWRVVEDRHFAADDTQARADLVVDGAADCGAERYVPIR